MCLHRITKITTPNDNNIKIGYKVFMQSRLQKGRYTFQYYGVDKLKDYFKMGDHLTKLKFNPSTRIYMNRFVYYESGFHVYTRLSDAVRAKQFPNEVIVKVFCWNVHTHGTQNNLNVFVCNDLRLMEKK